MFDVLSGMGFKRSKKNPCVYWHTEQKLKFLHHGDDVFAIGYRCDVLIIFEGLRTKFMIKIA